MGTTTDNQALPYPWEADQATVAAFKSFADAVDAKVNTLKASMDLGRMRPSFQVYNGTWDNISVAAGNTLVVGFTDVKWDTTGGWNLAANATTWTVPAGMGGKWWLRAGAYLGSGDNGTLTSTSLIFQKNGADFNPRVRRKLAWGGAFDPHVAAEVLLAPGDTVRLATAASGAGVMKGYSQRLEGFRVSL